MCALADPWESCIIGTVGSVVAISGVELVEKLKIDDPVGKTAFNFNMGHIEI